MTPTFAQPTLTGTMPVTIPSTALRFMSEEERAELLDKAFVAAPGTLATYLAVLDARLREFEHRYELPSSELHGALEGGVLRDTADVSEWLFWVDLRSQLAGQART